MKPIRAVVMGGSAGAFGPLREILQALPATLNIPVFVVLHQPRQPTVSLAQALAATLARPIHEATDKLPIVPGKVYTAPADYHLLIEDMQHLALDDTEKVCFVRPSIDLLFTSAARVYGAGLVGILLSGANQDGAAGLAAIQQAAGRILLQDPHSTAFPVMPQAALALCVPDLVSAPTGLGAWLKTHFKDAP